MLMFLHFLSRCSCCIGLTLALILSTNVSALDYELSDNGLNAVTWDEGRSKFEFADLNNDGHIDFLSVGDHGAAVVNNQHGILVHFGDGTGRWNVVMNGEFGYGGIAIGDVNNDGEWDVGYGMHHDYAQDDFGDQQIEVVLGDGSGGNWEPWDDGLAVPQGGDDWYGMFATDFGDINNDGLLDIGSNSFGSGTGLHIYNNLGNGEWEDVIYHFGRENAGFDFHFGDINNDGNLDFACSLQGMEVYIADGEGGFDFARGNLPAPDNPWTYWALDLGDVNGDGCEDIAFSNNDGGVCVYTYDPERERWNDYSDGLPARDRGIFSIDICDMDVDGLQDMVFGGTQGVEVWLQDPEGDPIWNQECTFRIDNDPGIQTLRAGGDIDHNGLPDIVVLFSVRDGMGRSNEIHVLRETSEAEELWIRPVEPSGGERFVAGSARFIDWLAAFPEDFDPDEASVTLLFSFRGADGPWEEIVEGFPNGGRYQWEVPDVLSNSCHIRYLLVVEEDTVDAVTPRAFSVLGQGEEPLLSVSAMHMDFRCSVDDEVEQVLTISNAARGELEVEPPELVVADVFIMDAPEDVFVLEEGASEDITITFMPGEEGEFLDTIQISSNGGNAEITLFGTTGAAPAPILGVSPDDTLDFSAVEFGDSTEMVVELFNEGNADLHVQPLSITGDDEFHLGEDANGLVIEPGGDFELGVFLVPSGYDFYTGTLVIESDGGMAEVFLSGRTAIPLMELSTEVIRIGPIQPGTNDEGHVVIYSLGEGACIVTVSQSGDGPFVWESFENRRFEPGDSLDITARFFPQDVGEFWETMTVSYQLGETDVLVFGTSEDASISRGNPIPTEFGIVSTAPNPFNNGLKITFGLIQAGEVNISLHDISGRMIKEISCEDRNAGYHVLDYNPKDIVSGMYLLCIQQADEVDLKKVVYLR